METVASGNAEALEAGAVSIPTKMTYWRLMTELEAIGVAQRMMVSGPLYS